MLSAADALTGGNCGEGAAPKTESSDLNINLETARIRKEIVHNAEVEVVGSVNTFADGILGLQKELACHAPLLRDYTALVVGDVRRILNSSRLFQVRSLPAWAEDSIAQKAIRECETVIAARKQIENPGGANGWDDGASMFVKSGIWNRVVQEWEALKSVREYDAGQSQRIPEADFRELAAFHLGIDPQQVSQEHRLATAWELCRHYRSIQVGTPEEATPNFRADVCSFAGSDFWKEREEEFRRYDKSEHGTLCAAWLSQDGSWIFRSSFSSVNSNPQAENIFKSLARDASKGLRLRTGDGVGDWLNVLRLAADEKTGRRIHAYRLITCRLSR